MCSLLGPPWARTAFSSCVDVSFNSCMVQGMPLTLIFPCSSARSSSVILATRSCKMVLLRFMFRAILPVDWRRSSSLMWESLTCLILLPYFHSPAEPLYSVGYCCLWFSSSSAREPAMTGKGRSLAVLYSSFQWLLVNVPGFDGAARSESGKPEIVLI